MPLRYFPEGDLVTEMPRVAKDYPRLRDRMSPDEIALIRKTLNDRIDAGDIHTAGWIPSAHWENTPFWPIFEKAALKNYDLSAKIFGLMVFEVFKERPEEWLTGRFENNGEPIGSRTYFRPR